VLILVLLGIGAGCSPDLHKTDADKEVYEIIDTKWNNAFGQRVNYMVSDTNLPTSPNDITIEHIPTSPNTLALAQAVAIATANNRGYQSQKESLYLSALSLTGIRHDYERRWFATIDGAYTDDSITDDEFSLHSALETDRDYLLEDGIEIGTTLAIDWARFLTGSGRTTLGSVMSAGATVPVLGSGGGKQKRETLVQAERRVLYDVRSFNRFRQNFVVETINAYYGVLQQKDAVTNAENNYKRVLESRDRLQMEAEAGRHTRIDVDEAQQRVLTAEDNVVAAHQRYERTLDDLKIRLGLPTDIDIALDQNELKALEDMGLAEAEFTIDEAIETALLHRLDLANTKDAIDDALRKVHLAVDGLGPRLDILANIDLDSPPGTNFQELQFNKGVYNFGFDADLPLDRKIQRNSYRQALINLQRQQRQHEGEIDNIKLQVRDAYRLLQETADRYKIQKNSLELARQRVESNKLLLDAGRVTVRILLESQDALVGAENAVTSALVSHLDARLSFYRDVGILQVRPDGMWSQSGMSKNTKNESKQQQEQQNHS